MFSQKQLKVTIAFMLVLVLGLAVLAVSAQEAEYLWVTVNQDNDAVDYTGVMWTTISDKQYYRGSETTTMSRHGHAEFTFEGSAVRWIASTGGKGIADVYLDGELVAEGIDLYSEEVQFQQVIFEALDLEPGVHVLKIDVTGKKNPASTTTQVGIDAFQYIPSLASVITQAEEFLAAQDIIPEPRVLEIVAGFEAVINDAKAVLADESAGLEAQYAAIVALNQAKDGFSIPSAGGGPILAWGFDGGLSGAEVVAGEATFVDGVVDTAVHLDGATALALGSGPAFQPSELSVSYWFMRTGDMQNKESIAIWSKDDMDWAGNGWYITMDDRGGSNRAVSVVVDGGDPFYVSADLHEFYPENEWVNVVVTFSSETGEAAIYRNGVPQEIIVTGAPKSITASDIVTYLGYTGPGWSSAFAPGAFDEIRIYDRVITEAEVKRIASRPELVATWSFEGELDGDAEVTLGEPTFVDGVKGQALNLDGTSAIALGSGPQFQPAELTASYWFKRTGDMTMRESIAIWAKDDMDWAGNGWYITMDDRGGANKPVAVMVDGGGSLFCTKADLHEFYPENEWVHVVISFSSATGEAAIYRNGVPQEVVFEGTPESITASDIVTYLGYTGPGWSSAVAPGVFDEVAIYSSILTPDEVMALYRDASLVGYWSFDGTLDGAEVVHGEPPFVQGVSGRAIGLGTQQGLNLGSDPAFKSPEITVSWWIRRTGDMGQGAEYMTFWAKGSGDWAGNGWFVTLDARGGTPHAVKVWTDGQNQFLVEGDLNDFYPEGEWVHVAFTFSSETQEGKIYKDGVLQDVKLSGTPETITAREDAEDNNVWIGFNSPAWNSAWLPAEMDEIRIYNRVLTDEEIIGLAIR